MKEVQEAILEFQAALAEFGSPVVLHKKTQGTYNPEDGSFTSPSADVPLQALIKNTVSTGLSGMLNTDSSVTGFERVLTLYHTESPTKAWTVSVDGEEHQILKVYPYRLQGQDFKYEILVRK